MSDAPLPEISREGVLITEFLAPARQHGTVGLIEAYPHALLVQLTDPAREGFNPFDTPPEETVDASGRRAEDAVRVGPSSRLYAVVKQTDVFPGKTSVGRAANNDIVIVDPLLSKLHAYFSGDLDELRLTDPGSRNGTLVNGERLGEMAPRLLASGDRLSFGIATFVLFDPAGVLAGIDALLGTSRPAGDAS